MVVLEKACVFHERNINHVILQFHHSISDKEKMYRVMGSSFHEGEFRGGADLVPFSEEELEEICQLDAETGESWTPPEIVHPSDLELCDRFLCASSEPIPIVAQMVPDPTPGP